MARGDGRVQFFEAGVFSPFDFLRDSEGKAAVAQDRADKAQRKADSKKAATDAGIEAEAIDADVAEMVTVTRTSAGGVQVNDAGRKRAMLKLKSMLKQLKGQVDANTEATEANREALLAAREFLAKLVQFLMAQKRKGTQGGAAVTGVLIPIIETYVDVINIGDDVHSTVSLAASHVIDGLIDGDVTPDDWNGWLKILALLLKGFAYYDVNLGLTSIIQADVPAAAVPPVVVDFFEGLSFGQQAGIA